MIPCVNGNQNIIKIPGSIQNPPNGSLQGIESLVYYMRAFSIVPVNANDYQLTIDQPLVVPQGFALEIDGIEAVSAPTNSGEPAATAGFMCLDAPTGQFNEQAGIQTSFDLGNGGAGIANPGFFSPGGGIGTKGGLVHIWGGSNFMHPGGPFHILAPDNLIVSTSTPTQSQSTIPNSDQTSSGGSLYNNTRKIVYGGFSVWLAAYFTPIQSHAVLITFMIKGRLILSQKMLDKGF